MEEAVVMRKYIVGAVLGAILATGIPAHAAILNMIGKQVDGTFPVKVNGSSLDKQAIVIDGTSYLPVRALGDALNMDISFNADLGIELKSKGGDPLNTEQEEKDQILRTQKIDELSKKITELTNEQISLEGIMAPYGSPLNPKQKDASYYESKKKYDDNKSQLDDLKIQLDNVIKEQNEFAESKKQTTP